jgi:hypothetical protein
MLNLKFLQLKEPFFSSLAHCYDYKPLVLLSFKLKHNCKSSVKSESSKINHIFFIAVTTILSEMYLYKSNAYPPNKNIKLKHQTDKHSVRFIPTRITIPAYCLKWIPAVYLEWWRTGTSFFRQLLVKMIYLNVHIWYLYDKIILTQLNFMKWWE